MNGTFELARPWALILLLAIPLALWVWRLERRRTPRLRLPPAAILSRSGRGLRARLGFVPAALLVLAIALAALALARPQMKGARREDASVEGIDIVIAFDLSTSMKAADFKPQNRLHVAKAVLQEFIEKRKNDRIGLVTFAGDAYTQCPLTLDYGILLSLIQGLDFGVIEDGTAIGNAVATAVNRLRDSTAKSKVIILITDGDNNSGQISPMEAAQIARTFGIKVFTILVGKGGLVPYPTHELFGRPIYELQEFPVNPELLKAIARTTGGAYYNATDRATLESGLNDILDRLEKSRIFEAGAQSRPLELFPSLLGPAFWFAALALLLGSTLLRPFP